MNKSGRVMTAGDGGFNKKQESSCEQLMNGAGRQSNSDKCDSLFGITTTSPIYIQFIYINKYSCTMSVHADSPPPKTLISYGARDCVQTSTPPNEISF